MEINKTISVHEYVNEKPRVNEEIVAYSKSWVEEKYNPNGFRMGFMNPVGTFISAYFSDEHDCWESCIGEEPELWYETN